MFKIHKHERFSLATGLGCAAEDLKNPRAIEILKTLRYTLDLITGVGSICNKSLYSCPRELAQWVRVKPSSQVNSICNKSLQPDCDGIQLNGSELQPRTA
jgi:hypothetical protein